MPLYTYECSSCKEIYDIRHSFNEDPEVCEVCDSKDTLVRIPSMPFIAKKFNSGTSKSKPGSLVNKHIEETRQSLKEEREKLKQREHE
jgi:putative FmdB family regulatory protein